MTDAQVSASVQSMFTSGTESLAYFSKRFGSYVFNNNSSGDILTYLLKSNFYGGVAVNISIDIHLKYCQYLFRYCYQSSPLSGGGFLLPTYIV